MKTLRYFLFSTILVLSCASYKEPIFRKEPIKSSNISVTARILTRSETLDKLKIDFYEAELAPVVINIHNGTPDPITISYQDIGMRYKESKSEFKPQSGEAISNLLKTNFGSIYGEKEEVAKMLDDTVNSAVYGGILGALVAIWVNDAMGGHYVDVSDTALDTAKWYGITTLAVEALTYDPSKPKSSLPKKYGNLGEGAFLVEGTSNAEVIVFMRNGIRDLRRILTLETLAVELKKEGIPIYMDFINFSGASE